MIIDSSVLLQILFEEAGSSESIRSLGRARQLKVAAPSFLETEIVFGATTNFGSGAVAELIDRLEIEVVPFTREHAREARLAYARFGKGQGHPASLNFGDCISYAVAKVSGEELAYKGNDFGQTDLKTLKLG